MAYRGWVIVVFLLAFVLVCGLPWVAFPVLLFLAFLASGGRNFPKVFFKTLPRDLRGIFRFGKLIMYTKKQARENRTISDIFHDTVAKHPNKAAFIFEERTWTFQEVEEYSNKIANYYQSLGYGKGDTVALFMESCPEYVCLWFGLSKLGVTTALINFNLRLDSLVHCISVAKSRALIFGTELSEAVKDIKDMLPGDTQFFAKGSNNYDMIIQAEHLDKFLNECSPRPPITTHPKLFTDMLLYIYTSGTTGLPKAAIMRNSRYIMMGCGISMTMGITSNDIIYCPLPLYHSAGGIAGVGTCLLLGATLVIRRRFSASRFWDDCIQHKATVVQYIGELCRYVLAQPPRPTDTQHCVQVALGNGLKPQIWKEFQSRFNIKRIAEFYGSTEGNVGLVNIDGTPGSCGFVSMIFPWAYPVRILKVDEDTGEIVRGPDGRAVECGPGEVGQPVGKLDKSGDFTKRFDGYMDKRETSKKLAHDVFKKGDSVFLSGDLLLKDEYGNLYFKDRTGDTFRWRGENVSTTEVEDLISKVLALKDVVVYAVEVPGTEGKAGMAAIVDPDDHVDLSGLAADLKKILPSYARPVFLRIVHDVSLTGTFKLQKVKLRKEGFDVGRVKDRLYYQDPKLGQYVPINQETYEEIMHGKIRL